MFAEFLVFHNIVLLFLSFVCFGVFRPFRKFFTHMETSPLPKKGANFVLYSALMAIEQWVFWRVTTTVTRDNRSNNSHLRENVTFTRVVARLAVERRYLFYDLGQSRLGFKHSTFRMRSERSNFCATARRSYLFLSDKIAPQKGIDTSNFHTI